MKKKKIPHFFDEFYTINFIYNCSQEKFINYINELGTDNIHDRPCGGLTEDNLEEIYIWIDKNSNLKERNGNIYHETGHAIFEIMNRMFTLNKRQEFAEEFFLHEQENVSRKINSILNNK